MELAKAFAGPSHRLPAAAQPASHSRAAIPRKASARRAGRRSRAQLCQRFRALPPRALQNGRRQKECDQRIDQGEAGADPEQARGAAREIGEHQVGRIGRAERQPFEGQRRGKRGRGGEPSHSRSTIGGNMEAL